MRIGFFLNRRVVGPQAFSSFTFGRLVLALAPSGVSLMTSLHSFYLLGILASRALNSMSTGGRFVKNVDGTSDAPEHPRRRNIGCKFICWNIERQSKYQVHNSILFYVLVSLDPERRHNT